MNGADLLSGGQAVTLEDVLLARDTRAARQQQAVSRYRLPLISFSLVAPGTVKNSPVWRRVADYAVHEMTTLCQQMEWMIVREKRVDECSGQEWIAAVCAPAKELKRQMLMLESHHPLGRLWDIDVIDSDGQSLSRRKLGFPARRCLICQQEAHVCARSRQHTLDLLLDDIARRIECYEREYCD